MCTSNVKAVEPPTINGMRITQVQQNVGEYMVQIQYSAIHNGFIASRWKFNHSLNSQVWCTHGWHPASYNNKPTNMLMHPMIFFDFDEACSTITNIGNTPW